MTDPDLLRYRRCRALQLAIVLGLLLPVFQVSWITVVSAVVGIAILALVYRRHCRREADTDSAQ
jgi:hypothetical protein